MSKRRKFVVVSLLLCLGLLGIQLIGVEYRYQAIALLGVASFVLSALALGEDLQGVEWLTVLTLPTLYPISVGLFYFLLPERIVTRLLILVFFGVGIYALLLTENIFSVAAIRTIQLFKSVYAFRFF